jgi:hypothetical protein
MVSDPPAPVLAALLTWLTETVQPDTALCSHHGITTPLVDGFRCQLAVHGYGGHPVLVVSKHEGATVFLTAADVTRLTTLLTAAGVSCPSRWNGAGMDSGSWALALTPHPSLEAAWQRYRAWCPTHHQPFCADPPLECPWGPTGLAALVVPNWSVIAPA